MATALYPAAGIVDFVISEAELFRSRDNITVLLLRLART